MTQTNYGPMQLEEYAKGKVRLVQGGVDSRPDGRKLQRATDLSDGRPGKAEATRRSPAPLDAYDSKLEACRADYLFKLQLAKDVRRVVHHPFTVHLSEKRSYTPDNLIEWKDSRITIEEVKGNIKQKNARDSITRLHLAAAKLPMFDWRLTMRIRGQWEERKI